MNLLDVPRLDKLLLAHAGAERADELEYLSYRHRASAGGQCVRELCYAATGIDQRAVSDRMAHLLDDGNVHEDASFTRLEKALALEELLKQLKLPAGEYRIHSRQAPVDVMPVPGARAKTQPEICNVCKQELDGTIIHGHIDWILDTPKVSVVVDHKAIGAWAFDRLDEPDGLSDGYVIQVCEYIYGISEDEMNFPMYSGNDSLLGALLYKNKNTSAMRLVAIKYDKEEDVAECLLTWSGKVVFVRDVLTDTVSKFETVEQFVQGNIPLPSRPYASDSFKCEYCPYQEHCWKNYPQEIKARGDKGALSADDALTEKLIRIRQLRDEQKESDEEEKLLRAAVLAELEARDLRAGTTPNGLRWSLSGSNRPSLDKTMIPEDLLLAATRWSPSETLRIDRPKEKKNKEG